MTIWFTADTHFGYEAIATKLRKFNSSEEHDELIMSNIKKCMKRDDTLWILGDFSERCGTYRMQMGKMDCRLVLGNHDSAHTAYKSFGSKMYYTYNLSIDNKVFNLNHYPQAYWDGSHVGAYSLYGHVHAAREETLDGIWPDRRSMDVGVDNAKRLLGEWRPFAYEEILEILKDRSGHDPLDWYKKNKGEL